MFVLLATLACLTQEKTVESAHYRLTTYGEFADAQEFVDLAEALHAKLKPHFGAEPREKGKLEIKFWTTADAFKAGGKADGVAADRLQAGGVYWTGTKRAYFWKQPSLYATRHLFLHELTHQFHFLAVTNNELKGPGWYQEGIAEYFAYHRWDGKKLETGLYDVVALEERVPKVVDAVRAGTFDFAGLVRGTVASDYGTSWAVVHYMMSTPGFKGVESKLWKSGGDVSKQLLAPKAEVASEAARKFLAALRPTWKIETINWDERGGDIVGHSETSASIATRWACASVEATVAPSKGGASIELRVAGGGTFALSLRDGTATFSPGSASVEAGAKPRLRLEVVGGKVRALVDGKEIGAAEGGKPGVAALCIGAGRAVFSDVKLSEK